MDGCAPLPQSAPVGSESGTAGPRAALLLSAVTVLAAVLGGCSSGTASSTTTSTSTTSRSASSTATTRASGSSSTSSTTSGTDRCPTTGLSASVGGSNGAAGTIETTVVLHNVSSTACLLGGYPGLLMLGTGGTALPTTVVRKGAYSFTSQPPVTVTLAPGGTTSFNIGYSDVPVGGETSCPSSVALEVTPPGAYDHLTVPATLAPCAQGTLVVSPVLPASEAPATTG